MRNIIISNFLIFLFISFLSGCDSLTESDEDLPAKPIIKKTSTNYTQQLISSTFPKTEIHEKMNQAYSGKYSEDMRQDLLEYIKKEISGLGESVGEFDEILKKSGCDDQNLLAIPTYAERAKYENEDAWILQIANGLNSQSFEHYKIFVFSLDSSDTLFYEACR